jgi:hypothetical protein
MRIAITPSLNASIRVALIRTDFNTRANNEGSRVFANLLLSFFC